MSDTATTAPKQQRQQPAERQPIPIAKLIIAMNQPSGVPLPWGMNGETVRLQHQLIAGISGTEKMDIEWRPWMRMYRVVRSRKVTGTYDGKEVISWEPMGTPYVIPETWAVGVLGGDL